MMESDEPEIFNSLEVTDSNMLLTSWFVRMCHLDGEPQEAHSVNQTILYNHDILEECFTILQQPVDLKLMVNSSNMYTKHPSMMYTNSVLYQSF